jgi:membrane-associated phospholipid phosphatase
LILLLGMPCFAAAQDPAPPDSDHTPPPWTLMGVPGQTTVPQTKGIYLDGWKRMVPNLLRDQKRIWLFPVSLAKGRHLGPTLALTGVTSGLVALDPYGGRYFRRTRSFDGFGRAFSGYNTARGMILFPTALYAIGLVQKDRYAQETYLLAAEAVFNSEILTSVMKDVTRRLNPGVVPTGGDFSDTWFKKKKGSWVRGIGSFPSGHTIAAFSVATIYAKRYPNPRWHRWVAYGLAGVVGFSRVSLETHFVSDVFAGAALGYVIASEVVLGRR